MVKSRTDRINTGITLQVTPQANAGDSVTLLIEPKISIPEASQFFPSLFVDTETRSLRTSVRVKDGATLMIGGLLSDQRTHSIQKVPLLGNIPLLGDVLTSKQGEGIFGMSYSVTGNADEPSVSVYPLSVLAPGIVMP